MPTGIWVKKQDLRPEQLPPKKKSKWQTIDWGELLPWREPTPPFEAQKIAAEQGLPPPEPDIWEKIGKISQWLPQRVPKPESEAEVALWLASFPMGGALPLAGTFIPTTARSLWGTARALPPVARIAARAALAPEAGMEQVLALPFKGLGKLAGMGKGGELVPKKITPKAIPKPVTSKVTKVKPGYIRLYRGETGAYPRPLPAGKEILEGRGRWFTTDPPVALGYGQNISYVDVPESVAADAIKANESFLRRANIQYPLEGDHLLTQEWAAKAKPLPPVTPEVTKPIFKTTASEWNKLSFTERQNFAEKVGLSKGIASNRWDDLLATQRETLLGKRAILKPEAGMAKPVQQALPSTAEGITAPVKGITPLLAEEGALQNRLPYEMPELGLRKARRQAQVVAGELTQYLGAEPPIKPPKPITETSLERSWWQKPIDTFKGIVARTYRTDRLLLRLDNYVENGKIQQAIWQPVEKATNQRISGIYTALGKFNEFVKLNKVNLGNLLSRKVVVDDIPLTGSERIGIYLHSQNPDNLVHVVFGNNIPSQTVTKIADTLTPEEKLIATHLQKFFQEQTPVLQDIVKQVKGKAMEGVENYFPIRLSRRAMETGEQEFNQVLINESTLRYAARWASSKIRKGFTLPRTGKAMQPIELDALGIWLQNLEGVEHYKAFSPVVRDLQWILNDAGFKRAVIKKNGIATWQVLDQWLKDVAQTNPFRVTSQAEGILRRLRVNATTAVLGLNITTAMKQFPSFISGMAEIGEWNALKGLFTAIRHPVETHQLQKVLAPQIYKRGMEREIVEARIMRGLSKRIAGKLSPRELFMFLTTTIDRLAVDGLWRGAYDAGLKKGMATNEAAEWATKGIQKTQPFFGIKDVPEYWRSGEFMRALTLFTNQLNNYWNYYRFDIAGKAAAGKISSWDVTKRIIETFVVPALFIGMIARSSPAKNWKDMLQDTGSMALATVPIVGHWLSGGIQGFYGSQGLVTMELLDRLQNFAYQANKGAWDKVGLLIPEMAGYLTGLPVAQPRRTIRALVDLANGKSNDWMEWIWGSYVREQVRTEAPAREITEQDWKALEEKLKGISEKQGTQKIKEPDWGKLEEALKRIK